MTATYNIYQRETLDQPPVQIATGLTTKNYAISGLTKGKKYLFSVGAVKNGLEKISNEKVILFGKAWTPINLTNNPVLYANSDNIIKVDGLASQLSDLSGNNNNLTQSISSMRPEVVLDTTINRQAIRFDGSNDAMIGNAILKESSKNKTFLYSFFVVARNALDSSASDKTLMSISTANSTARFTAQLNSSNSTANTIDFGTRRLDSDSFSNLISSKKSTTEYQMILFVADYVSGLKHIYVNGELSDSTTTTVGSTSNSNSNEDFCIGARRLSDGTYYRYANFKMLEMVFGNTAITSGEIDKLFGHAAHEYQLTSKLPSNHPYKTLIPTI